MKKAMAGNLKKKQTSLTIIKKTVKRALKATASVVKKTPGVYARGVLPKKARVVNPAKVTATKKLIEKTGIQEPAAQHIPAKPEMREIFISPLTAGTTEPPGGYGITRIIAMPRDPEWVFAYFEITKETIRNIIDNIGYRAWCAGTRILRIHDSTGIDFNGYNSLGSFDLEISPFASNWYIKMPVPNRSYAIDIGFITPEGNFILIARSNTVSMPRQGISDVLDEDWMTVHHEELFRMSTACGAARIPGSGFMNRGFSKRMRREFNPGSLGVSSFSRQIKNK